MAPLIRLSQLPCPPCQDAVLAEGFVTDLEPARDGKKRLADLFDCLDCRHRALIAASDPVTLTAHSHLSGADQDDRLAYHEPGHVAAALALGLPVCRTMLDLPPDDPRYDHGAAVTIIHSYRAPLSTFITMNYAGQQADLQRLRERHRDTRLDRLDARLTGNPDLLRSIDEILSVDPHVDVSAVLAHAQQQADALVAEHWPTVTRIATDLVRHRALTFHGDRCTTTGAVGSRKPYAFPTPPFTTTSIAALAAAN